LPSERIGPYRIEGKLGAGGMGEVYKAYDERLDRWVALKRISPHRRADAVQRERLRREARASARLSHPAIVQVFDLLQADGADWIVMELAEGTPLSLLLHKGPLEPARRRAPGRGPAPSPRLWPRRTLAASSTATSRPTT
jgi:serine/threonine-protein kinase